MDDSEFFSNLSNRDESTASIMHLIKRGKVRPDGKMGDTRYEDFNEDDAVFGGGLDARAGAESWGKTGAHEKWPRGRSKGNLKRRSSLKQKAEGLIMQNPPRKMRLRFKG